MDLLTNATVVDNAIRFVSSNKSKDNRRSLSNSNEVDKESNEPDYDEDEDQLKEQKAEAGGIYPRTAATTNQVF